VPLPHQGPWVLLVLWRESLLVLVLMWFPAADLAFPRSLRASSPRYVDMRGGLRRLDQRAGALVCERFTTRP
jgi:hypothetical protein